MWWMSTVGLTLGERVAARKELGLAPAERRQLRHAAGLTLAEVAAAIGVSPQAVQLWEIGARTPRGGNVVRFAEAMRYLREVAGGSSAGDDREKV